MSDKDGEKHVFSYMDGIPVKISEKYKPPRKIVLPVGFQNRLLQPPVCPDYDFQLEHDVLDKIEQWRLSRFAEKEKRKQRLAEEDAERNKMRETMQEIEKTMHELSTDEGSPSKSQPTPSQSPAPVPTVLQQAIKVQQAQPAVSLQPSSGTPVPVISEVNPILGPIPFKHQVVTSQMNNNKPISAFNLSDFEADTSSPFDNMELKTINDLEELAQVLQPTTTSQTQDYYLNTRPSEEHYANALHQSVNCHGTSMEQPFNVPGSNNILNDAKHGMNYQPHVNGFTSNYDYNSMQGYHPHPVIAQHGQAAAYNFAEREHMSQPNDIPFYTRQDPHHPLANYYSANAWPSAGYQPTRQPSYGAAAVSENRTELSNIGNIKLLPSSSIDRTEERSPDGTEGSVSQMAQQLSDLMKSRSSRYHQKPSEESTPENSSSVQSPTSPTEPDPFESLQSESQFLVRKIAEMGFPRARVARACQKLGTNDKKIVEFLLSLESLLDAGYQEGRAEHALSMHNQDLQATTKYLQVESQLLDLGFPVDRVSEALVKFNCDRDQALEFLIS